LDLPGLKTSRSRDDVIPSAAVRSPSSHEADAHARRLGARRLKRFLRFVPRRAVFHRYPVVGRFAATARRRAYLWSFKRAPVRRAIYVGAILSLWPVMGLQLLLALLGCAVLRANVMVAGALQFVTNPLTAAPVYYLTYRVGKYALFATGFLPTAEGTETVHENVFVAAAGEPGLTTRFAIATTALFVGGTLCGVALAIALDVLYLVVGRAPVGCGAPSHQEGAAPR
jgi:uncharacterized protein (DUF2062 family)